MPFIAVIEDEPSVSQIFSKALERAGHRVVSYSRRADAELGLIKHKFDGVVLDLKLDGDPSAGIGIISHISRLSLPPPVLVISSMDPEIYRPNCLELGVWDYLPKPIEERTLQIKIDRLIKDQQGHTAKSLIHSVGSLSWDGGMSGKVTWKGKKVGLPRISYRLTLDLATNAGRIRPHMALYQKFDDPPRVDSLKARQSLRSHIKTLRDCFRDVDPDFQAVQNVAGGYMWIAE
jgi:DNA-binding response OmpR family regulator